MAVAVGRMRAHPAAPRRAHTVATVVLPVAAVLAFDPLGLAPFGPAKWMAVSASVLLAASVVIRGTVAADHRAVVAWAAFLLVVAVAAMAGLDPLYAWIGTPERHFGWLTWLLCAIAFVVGQQLSAQHRDLCDWLARFAALAGAVALAQTAGWAPSALGAHSGRPGSLLGSAAFLGAFAALAVPPAWARASGGRPGAVAGAMLATGALVASGARAAWAGAAVAFLLAIAARRATRVALVALAAALALAVATGGIDRIAAVATDDAGGARGRLDEWRVAVAVVADRAVLGAGPEGYRLAFPGAVDARYEREHGREPLPDRAHSAVLDVAATAGLVGLGAYLVLVGVVVRRLVPAVRSGDHATAGLALGVAAYGVQALALFPLAEIDPLVWLVVGALVPAPARVAVPRPVPAVLAAAAAIATVAGMLDVAADRAARRVLDDVTAQVSPVAPDRAAQLRPDAIRYHLVAARGLLASTAPGAFAAALGHLERAQDLSPRDPVVAHELAAVLVRRAAATEDPQDVERAVAAARAVVRSDPNNARARRRLATALTLAGALDAARAERAVAASLEHDGT